MDTSSERARASIRRIEARDFTLAWILNSAHPEFVRRKAPFGRRRVDGIKILSESEERRKALDDGSEVLCLPERETSSTSVIGVSVGEPFSENGIPAEFEAPNGLRDVAEADPIVDVQVPGGFPEFWKHGLIRARLPGYPSPRRRPEIRDRDPEVRLADTLGLSLPQDAKSFRRLGREDAGDRP